jgi:hypothetical protein
MEIVITGGDAKVFVKMSKAEALCTIKSLTTQLLYNDPNTERIEHTTDNGIYFTIAVMPEVRYEKPKRENVICGMTGRVIPPEDAGYCNNAEGCDNCLHNEEE